MNDSFYFDDVAQQAGKLAAVVDSEKEMLHFAVYNSVMEIAPEEWRQLINPAKDLAMDQDLIHWMEKTLSDQARFWTVAVRNRSGRLIACANLSLFQTDIVQSSSPFFKNIIQKLRSRWPNALKLKVLFCGLPLPSGHSHCRFSPFIESRPVFALFNRVMGMIAKREGAALMVFKEFDSENVQPVDVLRDMGFYRAALEPIYEMRRPFKSFDDYLSALRSGYRRQVQLNIKKFNQFDFQIEHITDPAEIALRFTDAVHRLYLNVWEKAKEKLECFPAHFFRGLAQVMSGRCVLTLISREEKPVAFAIGLVDEEVYHNIYVGLDYFYAEKADLYFNLFYHEFDVAFTFNKKKILLGQTSGQFKSRLGAVPDARFFLVRPVHPILKWFFKCFRAFIFPKIAQTKENQVFR